MFGTDITNLSAAERAVVQQIMDRLDALETQSAKDVNLIADKVIGAIGPKIDSAVDAVNTVTLTINASVVEALALVRRIDGAGMTFKLAPE